VPSPLLVMLPLADAVVTLVMERLSLSTSEALLRSCSEVMRKLVSSGDDPRSTAPETIGASFTGISEKLW